MKGFLLLAGCLTVVLANVPIKKCRDHTCTTTIVRCPQCVSDQCEPQENGWAQLLPYPHDCTKYCVCEVGGAIEMQCPHGLFWNPDNSVCDYPNEVGCKNEDPYPACDGAHDPTNPPSPIVRCPACVSAQCKPQENGWVHLLPYPQDCSKYCACEVGGAIEMPCPSGLVFNPQLSVCDFPQNVDCSNTDPYPGCPAAVIH